MIISEYSSKRGRHTKILVELDLERHLLRRTKLKCDNETALVDFKNENMALLCFYCGKVRNAEKLAQTRKMMQCAVDLLMGSMGSGFGLI